MRCCCGCWCVTGQLSGSSTKRHNAPWRPDAAVAMGETTAGPQLTVLDVADLLQAKYAFISGTLACGYQGIKKNIVIFINSC